VIETGNHRTLVRLGSGVTEILIEQGINSTLIAHRGDIQSDEADRIKNIIGGQLSIVEGLFSSYK